MIYFVQFIPYFVKNGTVGWLVDCYKYIYTQWTWKLSPLLWGKLSQQSAQQTLGVHTIFKRDNFNIYVHIVYKILALLLAIISLLDQQKNSFTFTASRTEGDSFHVHCVYDIMFCFQVNIILKYGSKIQQMVW